MITTKDKIGGIFSFGKNICDLVSGKSTKYSYTMYETSSAEETKNIITSSSPSVLIFNYHPALFPWISKETLTALVPIGVKTLGFYHEITHKIAETLTGSSPFDYWIAADPTLDTNNPCLFKIGRPVPEYENKASLPLAITIGTFGLGLSNKGFKRLALLVQDQFDSAIIKMHIPFGSRDPDGKNYVSNTINEVKEALKKPTIKLELSHDFMSQTDLLDFLAGNTLNAFLYDDMPRGIASTTDYALAVERPIAITKTYMFRHLIGATPSICVEDNSLPTIIKNGFGPLVQFKQKWTAEALAAQYENMLDKVLS